MGQRTTETQQGGAVGPLESCLGVVMEEKTQLLLQVEASNKDNPLGRILK